MNIYKLWTEEGYAGLIPVSDNDAEKCGLLESYQNPMIAEDWFALETYIDNPLQKVPDFFWLGPYPCCSKATLDKISETLAGSVKFLPMKIEGLAEQHILIYPINVLDAAMTEEIDRRLAKQESHSFHYLFRREAFERPQLFVCKTHFPRQTFCASGLGDPQKDFYLRYKELGLTGINFICVDQPKD